MADLWKHKGTGGTYELLARDAKLEWNPAGMDYCVYRNMENSRVWIRPRDEFFDGRFEHVATQTLEKP